MRLSELLELLEDIQDSFPDEDPEVRLAIQPQWPFEHSIRSVGYLEGEGAPVVYISEGVQLGYLPRAAQDVAW